MEESVCFSFPKKAGALYLYPEKQIKSEDGYSRKSIGMY